MNENEEKNIQNSDNKTPRMTFYKLIKMFRNQFFLINNLLRKILTCAARFLYKPF